MARIGLRRLVAALALAVAAPAAPAQLLEGLLCQLDPSQCPEPDPMDGGEGSRVGTSASVSTGLFRPILDQRRRERQQEQTARVTGVMLAAADTTLSDAPVWSMPEARWATWMSAQGARVSGGRYRFDARSGSIFVAVERVRWDSQVIGFALSTTATDVSLEDDGIEQTTQQGDGLLYGLHPLGDRVSLEWGVDYGVQDVERRADGERATYRGQLVDAYATFRRLTVWGPHLIGWSAGLAGTRQMLPGYYDVNQPVDATNVDLVQAQTALEFSQQWGLIELYEGATYRHDLRRSDSDLIARNAGDDADEVELALGLRLFGRRATASMSAQWLGGRQSVESVSALALLHLQFD